MKTESEMQEIVNRLWGRAEELGLTLDAALTPSWNGGAGLFALTLLVDNLLRRVEKLECDICWLK